MRFDLTNEQTAIRDMAAAFAADRIAPGAEEWDEKGHLPLDVLRDGAGLGLAGINVAEEFGGVGLGRLDGVLIFEALATGCPSISSFLSVHNMCAWLITSFGSAKHAKRWGPDLCSLKTLAAYCLTEPGSGSDAAAMKTSARLDGEEFVINGAKAFITGGSVADLYVVMARTGAPGPKGVSAILVEAGTPGLSFGAPEKKMGWKAQPTVQVNFDDCRVPHANLLGKEGEGFTYAMKALDGGRLNIAAAALGGAQAAFDRALRYTLEREAFGQPLRSFQGVQFKLADMETDLQVSRAYLYSAAAKLDAKDPHATKHCAIAKRFVTDSAFKTANDALQLHGGYGYLADYGIEKIVRDLRVHSILEGANDIMRVIIARELSRTA